MQQMNEAEKTSGFTLVELAIVLMIIGLLIGGILRGQELMENARLQSISKQVTSYTAAITMFRDSYAAYPGDLATAQARVPGCQAGNANGCRNGDGNGIIGVPAFVWLLGDQTIPSEGAQFWKHMALTHLISGIRPNAAAAADFNFGISHPSVPTGGGLSISTSVRNANDPNGSSFDGALVLRLHNDLTTPVTENNPAISPKQASYIDRKMDDGIPNTGSVQSSGIGFSADCEIAYNQSREDKACVMAFLMNN